MTGTTIHLDAPLFLTWTQIVCAVIGCIILGNLRNKLQMFAFFPSFEYKIEIAKQVMPLTIVFTGMIVFNNLCLKFVEVSFYQVARSLTIVFNVLLSYFVLKQSTSRKSLFWVSVVIAGYLLGCDGEVNFSWVGVGFGVTASLFVAMYAIMVKRTLKFVQDDSWKLMIYSNINTMFFLPIIVFLAGEVSSVIESGHVLLTNTFWAVVIAAGCFGFLINIATFMQIQCTSPLTHNVSGTAKSGFQTILAFAIYGNPVTSFSIIGNALVLGGSLGYAYARMNAVKKPSDENIELEEKSLKSDALDDEEDLDLERDGNEIRARHALKKESEEFEENDLSIKAPA
jgi:GDP-fucose transporter C1